MTRVILLSALYLLLAVPQILAQDLKSGLDIGAPCPAFDPHHVSGPDKNSTTCPMCKYGSRQGVMIWVNSADWKALKPVLLRLEQEVQTRGARQFRAFVMFMNPEKKPIGEAVREATEEAKRLNLQFVALTVIPRPDDPKSAALFNINADPRVKNTVLVYSKRKVVHKVINLKPTDLNELIRACDSYFASHPM